MSVKKLAILFSGSGTNLENLLTKLHNKTFNNFKIEVSLTICNKPNAYGIERSRKFQIEPIIVDHKEYKSREAFDEALVKIIKKADVDLVVLAGFMRILTPVFTQNLKAINLHPSILPLFKGANAIKESFESDMKLAGVSVHFVSEELDGGKIIAQSAFEKTRNITFEAFEAKIHDLEYEILPKAVIEILSEDYL